MTRYYSSTAQPTTLSAACTNSATTIQVAATTGFPAAEFILALDYGTAQQELVKVTNVAGTTLTVVRGFDSTTAQAHALGAAVRHVHSADDFRLSRTHEAASSGVHGATGALVGTSDAQALTNKDLTSGTNTFPASLATDAEVSTAVSNHAAVNTGVHGVTGKVVGDTDAQTLTNKTVNLTSNTLSGTTAQFNAALSDNDFATLAGTETLTNKTLTAPVIDTLSGVTGVGKTVHLRKGADQSVTSTTYTDDTVLTIPLAANAQYIVKYALSYTFDSASGLKCQWVLPTGAVYMISTEQSGPLVMRDSATGFSFQTSQANLMVRTGASAGSLTMQFAQSAAGAIASVCKAESWVNVLRVA